MKQLMIALAGVLTIALFSCRTPRPVAVPETPVAAVSEDSLLLSRTQEVLTCFAERSFCKLSEYVHPEKGVRFSPYGYVDTVNDVHFEATQLCESNTLLEKRLWGWYDGTGDTIRLHFFEYVNKFVYTADFLHAEKTVVNQMVGHGNTLNNLQETYPGKPFTESWFSGFDPKYEGMDWCSLRLVYEILDGKPYLIAVIHDQWTI